MNYNDIQDGERVIVTSRGNGIPATVTGKFKSTSAVPGGAPIGTEYVTLAGANGEKFINYPHQLQPR